MSKNLLGNTPKTSIPPTVEIEGAEHYDFSRTQITKSREFEATDYKGYFFAVATTTTLVDDVVTARKIRYVVGLESDRERCSELHLADELDSVTSICFTGGFATYQTMYEYIFTHTFERPKMTIPKSLKEFKKMVNSKTYRYVGCVHDIDGIFSEERYIFDGYEVPEVSFVTIGTASMKCQMYKKRLDSVKSKKHVQIVDNRVTYYDDYRKVEDHILTLAVFESQKTKQRRSKLSSEEARDNSVYRSVGFSNCANADIHSGSSNANAEDYKINMTRFKTGHKKRFLDIIAKVK